MRTLIIPDLHHHTENADYWLSSQRYDCVIFLGDYFDNFGDNVNDARLTATWLRNRMDSTDDVMLLGNHDASYMFPHMDAMYCPFFTKAKAVAINEILGPKHWQRFKLAHVEQGWLLSHGGFHPHWTKTLTTEQLVAIGDAALKKAEKGVFDPLLGAGYDRGGGLIALPFGGPLWLDWACLIPLPGIHQIVGHTSGLEVREKLGRDSKNYCLDVRNGTVAAVLEEGRISILHR